MGGFQLLRHQLALQNIVIVIWSRKYCLDDNIYRTLNRPTAILCMNTVKYMRLIIHIHFGGWAHLSIDLTET